MHLYSQLSATPIASLYGDNVNDELGSFVELVGGAYYVIASPNDDVNGLADAGSARLFDGNDGRQIGDAIVGEVTDDMSAAVAQQGVGGDYYILTQRRADKGGLEDSGRVRIVLP